MRTVSLLFVICLFHVVPSWGQMPRCHYTAEDSTEVVALLKSGETTMLGFARHFLGRPYVAHTLELYPDDERLVLNMRELDCTTFVDVVVALTLCSQRGDTTFEQFVRQLHSQRYWGGVCQGYPSRIHYFSDWIDDNTRLGFVSEVQQQRAPFTAVQTLSVNYMTTHPQQYTALSRHPEFLPQIAQQEKSLTGRQYRFIPTRQVRNTEAVRQAVHDGDIIAITSQNGTGLDIAHLGLAVWHPDGLYLLDASSRHKKVLEEPITMRRYLEGRAKVTGFRVVRVVKQ